MSGKRLTARGARRRNELMEAAADLFAEKGYHATSVADIIRRENVGKGVFYWYFQSKDELFTEVLRKGMTAIRRAQADAIAGIEDPLLRIERGVRATFEHYLAHPRLFTLLELAASDESFTPLLRRGQETAVADTVRHIKDGIVEGRIREGDPHVLAHCIVGVTTHVMRSYFRRTLEPAGTDDILDSAVAFCLDGLSRR